MLYHYMVQKWLFWCSFFRTVCFNVNLLVFNSSIHPNNHEEVRDSTCFHLCMPKHLGICHIDYEPNSVRRRWWGRQRLQCKLQIFITVDYAVLDQTAISKKWYNMIFCSVSYHYQISHQNYFNFVFFLLQIFEQNHFIFLFICLCQAQKRS